MKKVANCFWCGSKDLKKIADRKDSVAVNECKKCGLLLVDSIPENLNEYYDTEEYFNPEGETETGYHENYDLISPFYLYWQGLLIEEISRKTVVKNLLEVGCATGNALEMVKMANSKIDVFGIDLSSYAIQVCQQKGIPSSVSKINGFKSKTKYDVILSSETMEHVDELREFVDAVKSNLNNDGVYAFFVPAVEKRALVKHGRNYPPLTTSLEHVSYFTHDFLEKALKEVFNGHVFIQQIPTGGEGDNYHLGFVSKNKDLIAHIEKYTKGFLAYDKTFEDKKTLYNLAATSAKFSKITTAEQYLEKLKSKADNDQKTFFLEGIIRYSKGELDKAKNYFEQYLDGRPADSFILKVFLSVEREKSRLLYVELEGTSNLKTEAESRAFKAEAELTDLKNSKIVGGSIKLRSHLGKALDPLRNSKKKITDKTLRGIFLLTPPVLRPAGKYMLRRQWRNKKKVVVNKKYTHGPLLSVVIPYYNRADTIEETIESLKKQTIRNFEVILVDDGSTDVLSVEKLKSINLGELKARIIHQKNFGVAAARNNGIKRARGKYIMCLDSDDVLEPTYIEKCLLVLETDPGVDLVTTDMRLFGVSNYIYVEGPYEAGDLLNKNMVTTAAIFRKTAWEVSGGYKTQIGYEDWEFWVNLAEHGFWGRNIPEPLFKYRTALSSRYVSDKLGHRSNMRSIKILHPQFDEKIKILKKSKNFLRYEVTKDSLFINLDGDSRAKPRSSRRNILIAIPWMTFGGAETLTYNFCREVSPDFNISFITFLESKNEWEYKFKEISPYIYHLPNLFNDENLYIEFISNYISSRGIDIVHVIHNGAMLPLIPEIKRRHPKLKIAITMFNDWVDFFPDAIKVHDFVDTYLSDNSAIEKSFKSQLPPTAKVKVIPNGINCYTNFTPANFNRERERKSLAIKQNELAVFFIGRLAEEKNPDVFVKVAKQLSDVEGIKFFMVGDGPMRPAIEKAIRDTRQGLITYLGYQSEIARFLSAADVFVLPSATEGFPLSILEAMAMKVAVVASRVGAVPDIIEDGKDGAIVKPGSVREIVDALLRIKKDPSLLRSFKNNSRGDVETKYSNVILGKNYRKLYKDLLK